MNQIDPLFREACNEMGISLPLKGQSYDNVIDNMVQMNTRLLKAVSVLREALDKNKQSIRYLLKHQNFPIWDDMTEFQKGFSVACQLAEKGISEEALAKADALLKGVE